MVDADVVGGGGVDGFLGGCTSGTVVVLGFGGC